MTRVYSNLEEEYKAGKESVAVIDRSNTGHLILTGTDYLDLIQRITTNEMSNFQPGEGQINIFTNEKGRIIDRVHLLKMDDSLHLLTSPENSQKVSAWIDKFIFLEDVKIKDVTSDFGMLSLFGPLASKLLNQLFQTNLQDLAANHFVEIEWNQSKATILKTMELQQEGYSVILERASMPALWEMLTDANTDSFATPMSGEVYEILRVEAGWPLYGQDFDEGINPHEARMLDYVDFDKGCYVGQEVVARLDTYEKVQKYLTGLILANGDKPPPRAPIFMDEKEVGYLTSVAFSIDLKKNIALGYIRTKFIQEAAEVEIRSENLTWHGQIAGLPFAIYYLVKSR